MVITQTELSCQSIAMAHHEYTAYLEAKGPSKLVQVAFIPSHGNMRV
ncbi:hypothetical protein [Desulfosporosinus sp.]|nr:hypothetical protein [Desulfosporosinus sp.]